MDLDDFSEGHSDRRTIELSDYLAFGLLDFRTTGHSDYWAFRLLGFRTIETSNYWADTESQFKFSYYNYLCLGQSIILENAV